MIRVDTPEGNIINAALRLAVEKPWAEVSVRNIADAAGVDLAEMRNCFKGKSDIIAAFMRAIDDEMLANAPKPEPGQSPRDSLFDVIMSRFDLLQPHKSALRSITANRTLDPALVKAFFESQSWILQAAGIDGDGLTGSARAAGLAAVHASVFTVWLDDDDPGMARTMAVLDRRLRRGERAMGLLDTAAATCGRMLDFAMSFGNPRTGGSQKSASNTADSETPPQAGPA